MTSSTIVGRRQFAVYIRVLCCVWSIFDGALTYDSDVDCCVTFRRFLDCFQHVGTKFAIPEKIVERFGLFFLPRGVRTARDVPGREYSPRLSACDQNNCAFCWRRPFLNTRTVRTDVLITVLIRNTGSKNVVFFIFEVLLAIFMDFLLSCYRRSWKTACHRFWGSFSGIPTLRHCRSGYSIAYLIFGRCLQRFRLPVPTNGTR